MYWPHFIKCIFVRQQEISVEVCMQMNVHIQFSATIFFVAADRVQLFHINVSMQYLCYVLL